MKDNAAILPPQSQVGAILVVADGQLATSLHRIGLAPVALESYLEALGEMSRGPVDLIIGRLDPLAASMEATIAALRVLAPGARMLLVIDAAQEPQAMKAVRLGFDDYIVTPFNHQQLLDEISNSRPRSAAGRVSGNPEPLNTVTTASARIAQTPPTAAPPPRVQQPRPQNVSSSTSKQAYPRGRPLGDIDLLDHLLQHRAGIRDIALQLMRERLGEPGLQWSEQPPQGDSGVVPIHYSGQPLGYLHSPRHTPAQLAGYAAWLSRWLALDGHLEQLNEMALKDELTGVWNRRHFVREFDSILRRAKAERFRVTLMLFDIDDFKVYNDRYGHSAGDDILREAARLMASVVRKHDIVARIGGDEFAVIFWDAEPKRSENSQHPDSVRNAARRFQKAIIEHRFPKLGVQAPGTLTISGGLASYPWDGSTAQELIDVADRAAMDSKQAGKNAVKFGPGALKMCGLSEPPKTGQ